VLPRRNDESNRFLNALRDCFHQGLSAKTGWGREELKAVFELAISNALA
jgi:hypothetical protein